MDGNKQLPCDIPGLGVPMKNQPGPITGSLIHLSTLHLNKMDYWPTLKSAVKNQLHPFTLSLPTSSEPYFNRMKKGLCPVNKNLPVTFGPGSCEESLLTQQSETSGSVNFPYFRLFPRVVSPKRPFVEIRT